MSFINGDIIRAAWLNAADNAAYVQIPQANIDLANVQGRILTIQSPGWAENVNFDPSIDWAKITGLPNSLAGYGIIDGGTLVNVRTFTTADSGSAYVPTPGTNKVVVEIQAGGGAGGTYAAGALSGYKITWGGQAGSYASAIFTSNVSGTIMTIGAGGVSDGVTNGGGVNAAGKTSSFGAFISCPGGNAGDRTNQPTSIDLRNEQQQLFGNNPSGIFQYTRRGSGGYGYMGSPGMGFTAGDGGSTKFGTGGLGAFNGTGTSNGSDATGFGSGGGGGVGSSGFSGAVVGGNGAPGAIIIWEYA